MSKTVEVIDLGEKFNMFSEYWHPRIVGELNDSYVKLAKFKGEFVWQGKTLPVAGSRDFTM